MSYTKQKKRRKIFVFIVKSGNILFYLHYCVNSINSRIVLFQKGQWYPKCVKSATSNFFNLSGPLNIPPDFTVKKFHFFGQSFAGVEEWKTNLMSLAVLFQFLCAQLVSDLNISIIRSLRLCCWILFSFRCVLEIWCGWFWVVPVLQVEAQLCMWHQVGLLFFNCYNDSRSNKH